MVKKYFGPLKIQVIVLNKLKSRGILASGLSVCGFPTLFTTLSHNLIKGKLTEFIEQTFNRDGSLCFGVL